MTLVMPYADSRRLSAAPAYQLDGTAAIHGAINHAVLSWHIVLCASSVRAARTAAENNREKPTSQV